MPVARAHCAMSLSPFRPRNLGLTCRAMSEPSLPFYQRIWFAWVCLLRVLFDGRFAARAYAAFEGAPELAAPPAPEALPPPAEKKEEAAPEPVPEPARPEVPDSTPAMQLLALLQREGRLIDFLEQDITSFPDAEIAAAARIVHEGCRKALRSHAKLEPVRQEEEGTRVVLEAGFNPMEVKLSGNVQGDPPHRGTLQHRGWRITELTLPEPAAGYDPSIVAPAEVEL